MQPMTRKSRSCQDILRFASCLMHCHMNPLRRRPFVSRSVRLQPNIAFTASKKTRIPLSSCVWTFRKRMVLVFRHRSSILIMQNWISLSPEESMSNLDGSGGGYESKRQAGHGSPSVHCSIGGVWMEVVKFNFLALWPLIQGIKWCIIAKPTPQLWYCSSTAADDASERD